MFVITKAALIYNVVESEGLEGISEILKLLYISV